jgi:glycosyltransferase involved in cell wall biosynthesis
VKSLGTQKPILSIIVPIGGFPNGIKPFLTWVGALYAEQLEVILVADFDDSELMEKILLISKNSKSKIQVMLSTSRNPGGSRNIGISKASGSDFVYKIDQTGTVYKVNYVQPTTTATLVQGGLTGHTCLLLKGNVLVFGGGQLRHLFMGTNSNTLVNQTNQTRPLGIEEVAYHNTSFVAIGAAGMFYELMGGVWTLRQTATKRKLFASVYAGGNYYLAGEKGYFTRGDRKSVV